MNLVRTSMVLVIVAATASCSSREPTTDGPVGSAGEALTSVNVFHSNWNGGNATGGAWSPSGSANFTAWESGNAQSRTAALEFWAYGYDPSSQVCMTNDACWSSADSGKPSCETYTWCYYTRTYWENGWGEIPSADFKVGSHSAHLTTDLANDPGFYATKCTWDSVTYQYACGQVTSGTFDVTWRDNGNSSTSSEGIQRSRYEWYSGSYSSVSTGSSSSSSADITGSALGITIAGGWGQLGTSKGNGVQKSITKDTVPSPSPDGGKD